MAIIEGHLKKTKRLSERVAELSVFLNQNSIKLDNLTSEFGKLFILTQRGDELIKIVRDYFNTSKLDFYNLKGTILTQEKNMEKTDERLTNLNEILKNVGKITQEIESQANLFIRSGKSLETLAKNAHVRAYKAGREARGFAIVAKESLKIASLAQLPFRNFACLLQNLREISNPIIGELDTVLEASRNSSILISQTTESLKTVDEVIASLERIIRKISEGSIIYSSLKKNIDEGMTILRTKLLDSLNTIDNISMLCAQIGSMSEILKMLEAALNIETNGRKSYVDRQFNYLLTENVKIFDKLDVKREAPLFPEGIHKNITDAVRVVNTLNASISEMAEFSESLGSNITKIANLQNRLGSFFTKLQDLSKRLHNLAGDLNREFLKIEALCSESGKIFSKMRTLAVYIKMEQIRSKEKGALLVPIVEEFVKIEKEIGEAFSAIASNLPYLKKLLPGLIKEPPPNLTSVKIPDYSKFKVFFDDLVRVFYNEQRYVEEIYEVTKRLEKDNERLNHLWEGYENSLLQIKNERNAFNNLLKEKKEYEIGIIKEKRIIQTALSNDPLTLKPDLKTDANSHQVINNFSIGLFQFGEGVDIIPALCEDYKISEDGKEYLFKIKKGIKYHNGSRLHIEDINNSFIKALSGPNVNFFEMIEGANKFIKKKDREIPGIEIVDNTTIKIRLEYPFLPLLANLATNVADPYIDADLPAAAGPFKISDYKKGKEIILKAYDDYFEGRPAIDELHFLISDNEDEKYELFKKGILSIYQPAGDKLEKIKLEFPDALRTIPELSVQYICINCQKPPFNNKLVRKACACAIDTNRLVNNFLKGNAIVAKGIFPPSMNVYNKRLIGYKFEPGKARQFLNEAGYKTGLPDTYPLDISDSPAVIKRAEFIKESLAKIGIKIDINPIPWHSLLEKTYQGNSILSFEGWVSDNGDPDNFLYPLFHSHSYGKPGNTFFFSRPDIDADIEDARRCRNMAQRLILYRKLEEKILDESPGIFLFHSLENVAIQKGIFGIKPHALGLVRGKYIYATH